MNNLPDFHYQGLPERWRDDLVPKYDFQPPAIPNIEDILALGKHYLKTQEKVARVQACTDLARYEANIAMEWVQNRNHWEKEIEVDCCCESRSRGWFAQGEKIRATLRVTTR